MKRLCLHTCHQTAYLTLNTLSFSLLFSCLLLNTGSNAQQLYVGYVPSPPDGTIRIMLLNPTTCDFCDVAVFPFASTNGVGGQYRDIVALPDGRIMVVRGGSQQAPIEIFTPPSQVPLIIQPPPVIAGCALSSNGLVYMFNAFGLYTFDPANNQVEYIGDWPASFNFVDVELYFYNGQLYGVDMNNTPTVIVIDINDPSQSFTTTPIPQNPNTYASVGSAGNLVYLSQGPLMTEYDPATNTVTNSCDLSAFAYNTNMALSAVPPSAPLLSCLCITDAGTVASTLQEICLTEDATVPFNNDEELDGDDLLQYILFSDLADTLGSILATSNTPTIAFNPATMQTGITYYLATIAGDNLNGNVNLNDDCLSISNASEVIWWPQPSVSFAISDPNVCAGQCITLNVSLTGTPPFDLAGEVLSGANVVGTFNQTFPNNTGTLEVCAPAGVAAGSLSVQAVSLVDGYCNCL